MLHANKVLLIDDDNQRRHDFKVILDFLSEGTLDSESDRWPTLVDTSEENNTDLLCVIIGSINLASGRDEVIKAVNSWDRTLPILIISEEESEPGHEERDLERSAWIHRVYLRT